MELRLHLFEAKKQCLYFIKKKYLPGHPGHQTLVAVECFGKIHPQWHQYWSRIWAPQPHPPSWHRPPSQWGHSIYVSGWRSIGCHGLKTVKGTSNFIMCFNRFSTLIGYKVSRKNIPFVGFKPYGGSKLVKVKIDEIKDCPPVQTASPSGWWTYSCAWFPRGPGAPPHLPPWRWEEGRMSGLLLAETLDQSNLAEEVVKRHYLPYLQEEQLSNWGLVCIKIPWVGDSKLLQHPSMDL